jgi:hypothetical protein
MRRVIIGRWAAVASLTSLAWVTSAFDARANVPPYLTEQGRLFDASGTPITAAVTMEFALYTQGTGGTALWSEKQTITPDAGYFSAELGSVTALTSGIFATAAANGQNLYLGVTVGADAEIAPRQPLQSVPYALVADNAVGNITPTSVTIGATPVIDSTGKWVGLPTGLVGPTGPAGASVTGPAGPAGASVTGPTGPAGQAGPAGAFSGCSVSFVSGTTYNATALCAAGYVATGGGCSPNVSGGIGASVFVSGPATSVTSGAVSSGTPVGWYCQSAEGSSGTPSINAYAVCCH